MTENDRLVGTRLWQMPGAPPEVEARDLPSGTGPGAVWFPLSRDEVVRRATLLCNARERVLLTRTTRDLVATLGRIGQRFLDPGDSLRRETINALPEWSGVSPPMARLIVDGMARDWTAHRLERLVRSEFPIPGVLEGFAAEGGGPRRRALGDPLVVQLLSGSVPGVSATAMLRALLVRSATLVKPGRGDLLFPLQWARAIGEEDPDLAGAVGVHYWPGGRPEAQEVEDAWLEAAHRVVVYGGPDAVAAARRGARPGIPVVEYPHRISVGLIAREHLAADVGAETARRAAMAVSAFDGRGCVCPQILFVEEGGTRPVVEWLTHLAGALDDVAREIPPGQLSPGEAGAIQQLRGTTEIEAALGTGQRVLRGRGTDWTILFDPGGSVRGGAPGRVVRVVPVDDLSAVPPLLVPLGPHLQTAALEVPAARLDLIAEALAGVGISRISTLAGAPWPPAWWQHDGQGPLRVLVRWVDLEGEPPEGHTPEHPGRG